MNQPRKHQGVDQGVLAFLTDHPGAMTRGQVRDLLGLSESTVKRYVRKGTIPAPALEAPNGWRVWSAEQVRELLKRRVSALNQDSPRMM